MSDHARNCTHTLDTRGLHARLDITRKALGLSWRAVADEVGIEPMALTRLGQGRLVDANTLVSLLAWLDANTPDIGGASLGDALLYAQPRVPA